MQILVHTRLEFEFNAESQNRPVSTIYVIRSGFFVVRISVHRFARQNTNAANRHGIITALFYCKNRKRTRKWYIFYIVLDRCTSNLFASRELTSRGNEIILELLIAANLLIIYLLLN